MERRAEILKEMALEVFYENGCFDNIGDVYESLEDLIDASGLEGIDIARATFFGDIDSWNDECFYFDGYGNFASMSEYDFEREILNEEEDIIDEFLRLFGHNLDSYQREWLEELEVELDEDEEDEE